jgi:hypothetical protein
MLQGANVGLPSTAAARGEQQAELYASAITNDPRPSPAEHASRVDQRHLRVRVHVRLSVALRYVNVHSAGAQGATSFA